MVVWQGGNDVLPETLQRNNLQKQHSSTKTVNVGVSFKQVHQSHFMWLSLGPVLQSGEDAIVALDDPVLLDGERLHLGGSDGHAETNLQNPTAYQTNATKQENNAK